MSNSVESAGRILEAFPMISHLALLEGLDRRELVHSNWLVATYTVALVILFCILFRSQHLGCDCAKPRFTVLELGGSGSSHVARRVWRVVVSQQ